MQDVTLEFNMGRLTHLLSKVSFSTADQRFSAHCFRRQEQPFNAAEDLLFRNGAVAPKAVEVAKPVSHEPAEAKLKSVDREPWKFTPRLHLSLPEKELVSKRRDASVRRASRAMKSLSTDISAALAEEKRQNSHDVQSAQ